MQRLGQSFNSAGIALFARVALVRRAAAGPGGTTCTRQHTADGHELAVR